MSRQSFRFLPDQYLKRWKKAPYLEQLVKAGLFRLAESVLNRKFSVEKLPAKNLAKSLGIDRGRMRRLKKNQGNHLYLNWLKFEMKTGRCLPDQKIVWFQKNNISYHDLEFILDRMTPERICNFLIRQSSLTSQAPKELIATWRDYLNMAKALKLDVLQEIFFKPKDVIASHNKMIQKLGGENTALKIWEMEEKYPNVDAICSRIRERYAFEDEKYRIIVPDGIRDIICEGTSLKLCVTWSGIYFERIEKRETYLFFLRKTEQPDMPFYLLEVEPGGTIRQKRTYNDAQTSECAEPWSTLTVNLGRKLEKDCAFIDTNNNGDGILPWLIRHGLGVPTGVLERSGYCVYPEFRFRKKVLREAHLDGYEMYILRYAV